jgi:hypothetical protein
MTMSEEHICLRMLFFYVNQAWFTVSYETFMTFSFVAYDVVYSYENDRGHVSAFLNPYNRMEDYIYRLAQYMYAAGCPSDNVGQFTTFIGIVAAMDLCAPPSRSCRYVTCRCPTPHLSAVSTRNTSSCHG